MKERRYVQHKSGQGEKWPFPNDPRVCNLSPEHPHFLVNDHIQGGELVLPKSEYVPCEPPETWTDVTDGCDDFEYTGSSRNYLVLADRGMTVSRKDGYRLRKVQVEFTAVTDQRGSCGWAFIVEKR